MGARERVLAQPEPVGEHQRAQDRAEVVGTGGPEVLGKVDRQHAGPLVHGAEVREVREVLGPTHDHRKVLGQDRPLGPVHGPHLHGTVAGLPAAADHDALAPGALEARLATEDRAEGLGHHESRGVLQGLAHQQRVGHVVRAGQVVAHHHVAHPRPGQGVGEAGRPAALGQAPLDAIERPDLPGRDEGHDVAHRPAGVCQPLQRLVVRRPPLVATEPRAGHQQRGRVPLGGVLLLQPLRGRGPVARHGHHRLARSDASGEGGHRAGRHDGDRGGGEDGGAQPLLTGGTGAGPRPCAELLDGVRETDDQGQPDDRVELVHVADRREDAVEQVVQGGRAPTLDRALVAERDQDEPHRQTAGEERPVGVAAQHHPRAAEEQQHPGVEREVGRAQEVAPGPGGGVDVGDPVRGAAQGVGDRGGERRDRGRLDPVQEGRAVGAHHHQGHQPPQGAEEGEHRPPEHERATARTARAGQQPHDAERDHREGGRGVDTSDARRRDTGPGRCQARGATLGADDQGQQHPRGQCHRPALAGDRPHRRQHARRERVGGTGQEAGEVAADPERAHQARGAGERHRQDQAPPQPLHHPAREPSQDAGQEERGGREEVAVGLVLQLAEGALTVPEMQRAHHEVTRCGDQVELGVGHEVAGVLGEREPHQQPAPRQHPPGEGAHPRLSNGSSQGHRRRSTSTRFQVTSSRSTGTRSIQRLHHGL